MSASRFYTAVKAGLAKEGVEVNARELTEAVLAGLAERLSSDEAAELGAELPEELGDILARASGDGRLDRDGFIEYVASRLDLDDESAERATAAVLHAMREELEPFLDIDQMLEILPADLAQLLVSA